MTGDHFVISVRFEACGRHTRQVFSTGLQGKIAPHKLVEALRNAAINN